MREGRNGEEIEGLQRQLRDGDISEREVAGYLRLHYSTVSRLIRGGERIPKH
jgi:plasmid maintenance system antidote protein VapI